MTAPATVPSPSLTVRAVAPFNTGSIVVRRFVEGDEEYHIAVYGNGFRWRFDDWIGGKPPLPVRLWLR